MTEAIRVQFYIPRAQFEKLTKLGIIDPSKPKNGITQAVRQGLEYLIDNELNFRNHVRRNK